MVKKKFFKKKENKLITLSSRVFTLKYVSPALFSPRSLRSLSESSFLIFFELREEPFLLAYLFNISKIHIINNDRCKYSRKILWAHQLLQILLPPHHRQLVAILITIYVIVIFASIK